MSLEDELTCSICLSTFDCPVTIPCGHNFCQDCLLASWEDSYSCPQCRTVFDTKPELKKNTGLCAYLLLLEHICINTTMSGWSEVWSLLPPPFSAACWSGG
uniref:RING-type domain-containing protein n=1 Tax=Maylandia zebra TaxID=106582 RepID=A0A3P9DTB6_9CICH